MTDATYWPKPGQMRLFKNKGKKRNKAADYHGRYVDEHGELFHVSGWQAATPDGEYYLELRVKRAPRSEAGRHPKKIRLSADLEKSLKFALRVML